MRIVIIGAGITGLTAAYRLSQQGHQVVVLEKEKKIGGLTTGFKRKSWQWHLENFFHHFFTSDQTTQNLIAELGLKRKLFYSRPRTSLFYRGKINQFDSPFSVFRFPYLSLGGKIRTGIITAWLKASPNWQNLEKTTASQWLSRFYGQKTYRLLWQPLLEAKFGSEADRISMAWFWARIKKRSTKLGYLEGGFQTLIDKLTQKIKQNGGQIVTNREISKLKIQNSKFKIQNSKFDRIIFTTPVSIFLKTIPSLPKEYRQRLEKLKMIGALNLILVLKEPFLTDGTYWLNVNEKSFPFVAAVEHTNFIDPKHYGGNHILYVGGYYPQSHRYFKMKKEQVFKEFLPYLQKINPNFDFSLFTLYSLLFTNLHAQPVITPNYSRAVPSLTTPLPNVFLANMQTVYPWDRGVNYAIDLGNKVAKIVQTTNDKQHST